jgi:hypothetical protein
LYKVIYFTFLFLFCVNHSFSQTYKHTSLWTRLALQKVSGNLDLRLEYDYRRQNDFHQSTFNPTSKPLMEWIRLNIGYKKGIATYYFMPAFIKSYQLLGNEGDYKRLPRNEFRLSFYDEIAFPKNKFTTRLRLGYEFRDFYDALPKAIFAGRGRFRVLESYKISNKTQLLLSIEPQLNIWPNKPTNLFSSNQIYGRLQQNITKNLKLELGYNIIHRQRASLIEYDNENAIICNLMLSL